MMEDPICNEEPWEDPTIASMNGLPAPPGEERIHSLVVMSGNEPGRRFEFGGRSLTIGRAADSDIRIRDPELSSHHCKLTLVLDRVLVADLTSTNGTFIDGERINCTGVLPIESLLQIGRHVLKHEFRSRVEIEHHHHLQEDLEAAADYVRSLLPEPINQGPVRTDWVYQPCSKLGGDAFGYHFVNGGKFAMYFLDVSGHGTDSSLHAISVLNVLSQQSLADTDFCSPQQVISRLNLVFRMQDHADKYFTMWYGVYDPETRELRYASAGHPPAYLISDKLRMPQPLQTGNPGVGLFTDAEFVAQSIAIPPHSSLVLFSDGAYEIPLPSGGEWTLDELKICIASQGKSPALESEEIYRSILTACSAKVLPDDCSIVAIRFP